MSLAVVEDLAFTWEAGKLLTRVLSANVKDYLRSGNEIFHVLCLAPLSQMEGQGRTASP